MKMQLIFRLLCWGLLIALPIQAYALSPTQARPDIPPPFPVLNNLMVSDANGDSIVRVTANGLSAIVALPGQNLDRLLAATGLNTARFASFNDLPPILAGNLTPGALYYLEAKNSRAPTGATTHTVQARETLWDVAQKYGITTTFLMRQNRIDMEAVEPGTVLLINRRRKRSEPLQKVSVPGRNEAPNPWQFLLERVRPTPVIPETTLVQAPQPDPVTTLNRPTGPPSDLQFDPNAKLHTVQAGQNLFSISSLYNVKIMDLRRWNNFEGNEEPKVGDVIIVSRKENIPPSTTATATDNTVMLPANNGNNAAVDFNAPAVDPSSVGQPSAVVSPKTHMVARGETVYSIAREYGLDPKKLMAWNGFDNNTKLSVGESVVVSDPAAGPSAAVSPTKSTTALASASPNFNTPATDTPPNTSNAPTVIQPDSVRNRRKYALDSQPIGTAPRRDGSTTARPIYQAPSMEALLVTTTPSADENRLETIPDLRKLLEEKVNLSVYGQANVPAPTTGTASGTPDNNFSSPAVGGPATTVGTGTRATNSSAAAPQAAAAPARQARFHTVQPGETLYALAKKYGVTVESLQEMNEMYDTNLRSGQPIVVGYGPAPQAKPQSQKPATTQSSTQSSAVRPINVNTKLPPNQLGTAFGVSNAASANSPYYALVESLNPASPKPLSQLLDGEGGSAPQGGVYHVVQQGETLYRISQKYKVSVSHIKQINGKQSDVVVLGEKLRIR